MGSLRWGRGLFRRIHGEEPAFWRREIKPRVRNSSYLSSSIAQKVARSAVEGVRISAAIEGISFYIVRESTDVIVNV
jgi:hypothetical protein